MVESAGDKTRIGAFATLALVMLLWAGNSIVGRAVAGTIPPLTLAFLRWTGALLILLPFVLRQTLRDWPVLRRHWRAVLLLGLTGVAAFNAFLYSGLHYTMATNALLLQAAIPALVLLVDRLLFRVRSTVVQLGGVLLSTLGVLVIIARGDPAVLAHLHFGRGDVLVLCGVLCWALYTSLLKLRPPVNPFSFLAVTFAVGVVAMAPLAASEWPQTSRIVWTPGALAAVAYVAVLPSVVAYALYNRAVAEVGAARAGQAINLMPVMGALLAATLLGETLHGFHFVGMALILGGIAVAALWRRGR